MSVWDEMGLVRGWPLAANSDLTMAIPRRYIAGDVGFVLSNALGLVLYVKRCQNGLSWRARTGNGMHSLEMARYRLSLSSSRRNDSVLFPILRRVFVVQVRLDCVSGTITIETTQLGRHRPAIVFFSLVRVPTGVDSHVTVPICTVLGVCVMCEHR